MEDDFQDYMNSRSLRGNVDRNLYMDTDSLHLLGRSLRGNVDRNWLALCFQQTSHVVPYVGTWIEILSAFGTGAGGLWSFPTWERG